MGDWDPMKIAGVKRTDTGTWTLFYHRYRGEYYVVSYSRIVGEVMIWPAVVQKVFGKITDFIPDMTQQEVWVSGPGESPGKIFSDLASGKISLESRQERRLS
jgi:hypothetical protein